MKLRINF